MTRTGLAILLTLAVTPAAAAQEPDSLPERPEPKQGCGAALNIGAGCSGLSIGNSHRWNGLRINFIDRYVEQVNGLNITFWRSSKNRWATVNGLSLGVAPEAGRLRGVQLGLLAVVANQDMVGLSAGILAAVSGASMTGINVAGLATVSGANMEGLNVAGLATVAGASMVGVNAAILATVAGTTMEGLNVAGLATVAGEDMVGINASILATIGGANLTGVNVAGLAAVGGDQIIGLSVAGLSVVGGTTLRGVGVAGLSVTGGAEIQGFAAALAHVRAGTSIAGATISLWNRTDYMSGLAVGYANTFERQQHGLSIGIVNYAVELYGVQLGLLNIAENNRGIFRVLPILNVHIE